MKKISVIVLLLTASLVLFAGGDGESTGSGELVINSNLSDPAPKAAFEALVDAFMAEYPDIDVTLNGFDHEAYKTAIRNFLGSNPPDVALWFAGNRMRFFVDQGLILDITDLWEDADFNDSMASSKPAFTVDDRQYGVPFGYYQWGVYYRTDIFDRFGLSVPTTWDEYLEVCAVLASNGVTPITIGTKFLWTAAGWFDYLNLRINGFDYHIALTNGDVSYLDPKLDAVFDAWAKLLESGYFLADHAAYSWQEAQAPLINGEAAMYLIGNFITPDLKSAGVLDDIGFFQFPIMNPSIGVYEDAPTEAYLIPAGAKNPEEAKLFLEFASRPEVLADFAYAVGNIPPNKYSREPEDRFVLQGFNMLNNADGLAQFYDRDTHPEMASVGMEGFQEFMIYPEREATIRARLDEERKKIFN